MYQASRGMLTVIPAYSLEKRQDDYDQGFYSYLIDSVDTSSGGYQVDFFY
jgi:hypothetical protein